MSFKLDNSVWKIIIGAAGGVLLALLASKGCTDEVPTQPATPQTEVRRDSTNLDSLRAVLFAEFTAAVPARIKRVPVHDTTKVADSTMTEAQRDSLRMAQQAARDAFALVRRLQLQLQSSPWVRDIVAEHDTSCYSDELDLTTAVHQTYSYRDQTFGLTLAHTQPDPTTWDWVAKYAPWIGTLIGAIKLTVDGLKK